MSAKREKLCAYGAVAGGTPALPANHLSDFTLLSLHLIAALE